ncbi:alpha/beta-hydrolase [Suhomyces tanzawaensis NRRL Y-17324]|uniref:Palmitoyl-protein thioesterase 1 n=1 Tax=Suhomyces tanzawaensis NRRL Y-17324 TaxID=984487 RepID=A0A1E4SK07_9ASCO|nr:alpha/beta-hydrolase [Suhomyces tanzawaensis NRRL Y-17324]ODV79841.1 alpha/beta-hydrolase [Suhomyces tanzawaensis NRRL Y-17324]
MQIFKALEALLTFPTIWNQYPQHSVKIISDINLKNENVAHQEFRPVVIWHGLGDQYNSTGIHKAAEILDDFYPGIFVYSVYLDLDPEKDQKKSLFGDANVELEQVCEQLATIPELKQGFDLIGFSQGGLFLRALVERCSDVNVNNLITFGSPHLGVLELPMCENPGDWVCRRRNELLKKQVWFDSVQKRVIPAQYFRDPVNYNQYLLHSNFLVNVNNERPLSFNSSYKNNLQKLNKLVLFQFTRDTTLVPKETAWFIDFDVSGTSIPFEKSKIYVQDLIGLKELHLNDKIDFKAIDTDHMVISEAVLHEIAEKYLGK